jgi:hypothetical protein
MAPAPRTPAPSTPAPPTPVPAVAAPPTPPPPAPPPLEASIPPFRPEPGSSVQARPSSIPPEELSEDDLVEVTTIPPAPAAASSSIPATDEEEPPASSRRSKVVAESLDQAIANAASQADEHEVPIHTPPPESGPQEAVLPVGLDSPRTPEFAELSRPPSLGPTPEQLGETIDLDEAEGPAIEIEVGGLPAPEPKTERPPEELEVALPRAEMPSGTYDVEVSVPEQAAPAVPTVTAGSERIVPELTARPAAEAEITHVVRVTEKAPDTFAELLETSLRL